MKQPQYLKKGDTIVIISTARKIAKEELNPAVKLFTSWGLNVTFGKNVFGEEHQFSGTTKERVEDLQNALDQDEVKAIVCARGGYGTVQLVDSIDFTQFLNKPKWLVGYSDVTVLHNHINKKFDIETIHSTMPISFPKEGSDESTSTLRKVLFGDQLEYEFEIEEGSLNVQNTMKANIVGGNLSIIYSLTGTESQIETEGKWLFLEDLDEYLYHIDRMMANLKRAGIFKNCKGVLVGGMTDMNDNTIPYGKSAKEIIIDNLSDLNVSVIFGFPAGHIKRNLAIPMNRDSTISVKGSTATITFDGRA